MPIDEPISTATALFTARRVLDVYWTRALDRPWRAGGCLECRSRDDCPQLDWAIELVPTWQR
ncbi:hypothetical protein [Micromonospora sp. WMMD1155]|uniref:hypothetical protein n=1 Tax=Micromonospora sp. WMMD1155 TaxID=3016094 RepID=UPI00249C439A|nr:hypothetical protein [Micromonospora sp. WMMD1155]WFE53679.1 hypothetical protein O7617_26600 [Micromonospora sp. WMMD1155]